MSEEVQEAALSPLNRGGHWSVSFPLLQLLWPQLQWAKLAISLAKQQTTEEVINPPLARVGLFALVVPA